MNTKKEPVINQDSHNLQYFVLPASPEKRNKFLNFFISQLTGSDGDDKEFDEVINCLDHRDKLIEKTGEQVLKINTDDFFNEVQQLALALFLPIEQSEEWKQSWDKRAADSYLYDRIAGGFLFRLLESLIHPSKFKSNRQIKEDIEQKIEAIKTVCKYPIKDEFIFQCEKQLRKAIRRQMSEVIQTGKPATIVEKNIENNIYYNLLNGPWIKLYLASLENLFFFEVQPRTSPDICRDELENIRKCFGETISKYDTFFLEDLQKHFSDLQCSSVDESVSESESASDDISYLCEESIPPSSVRSQTKKSSPQFYSLRVQNSSFGSNRPLEATPPISIPSYPSSGDRRQLSGAMPEKKIMESAHNETVGSPHSFFSPIFRNHRLDSIDQSGSVPTF